MKATAIAPANIAFIKYWGKKDLPAQAGEALRLPLNPSISMNLSAAYTITTVEFSPTYHSDQVVFIPRGKTYKNERSYDFVGFKGEGARESHTEFQNVDRVSRHLDRLRTLKGVSHHAKVVTRNSFPQGAGIASSASGFAALTIAATAALGLNLSEKELSILARLGSGSACRSIPNGFVEWEEGPPAGGSETSYAHSLYPPEHWDLRDIVVIVQEQSKDVSSASGMENVKTSPKLAARLEAIGGRIKRVKEALAKKDIILLGETIEEECLDMHAVMQSQVPALHYWTKETRILMDAVRTWRSNGLAVYFTIDAGPNVHLICEGKDEKSVVGNVGEIRGVREILINKSAKGAHLI